MPNDQRGYTPGTEFLDARHAQRQQLDHQAREQAGRHPPRPSGPDTGELGAYLDAAEAAPPRPFGTGGMIDRVADTLSEVERLFDMLGKALEPTLERERTEAAPGTGPREVAAIPDTPHGEGLNEIDSRLKTLAYRINRLGSRVRL